MMLRMNTIGWFFADVHVTPWDNTFLCHMLSAQEAISIVLVPYISHSCAFKDLLVPLVAQYGKKLSIKIICSELNMAREKNRPWYLISLI